MKVAVTGSLKSRRECTYYYRGDFKSIFPMMREDGFGAVELHLRDSREIDRKKLDNELKKTVLRLHLLVQGEHMAPGI